MTATVTTIRRAAPRGEYQRTIIDDRKDAADFLLLQVGPYIIRWRDGRREKVTERQLRRLQSEYSWAPDF